MKEKVIKEKDSTLTGFSALYNVNWGPEIDAGTTLVYVMTADMPHRSNDMILFQTKQRLSVFSHNYVGVEKGSAYSFDENKETLQYFEELVKEEHVSIVNCRFPTQNELDIYNKQHTI